MTATRIDINAGAGAYSVTVGKGVFSSINTIIGDCKNNQKTLVITDKKVYSLYGKDLSLSGEVCFYIIRGKERDKSLRTVKRICEYMLDKNFCRSDRIVALGGGVVGDIAGFVAAIYTRGIDYYQVPTTFLAGIDSSVGGKTAVNLSRGKNMIGAFYPPKQVIFDTETLLTLPQAELSCGMGEAVKYAIINREVFSVLTAEPFCIEKVSEACIRCKKTYVEADEYDDGKRMLLNLGHTFGHVLERKYKFRHGQAVGMGLRIIADACHKNRILPTEEYKKINELFDKFGILHANVPTEKLLNYIRNDKKARYGRYNIVLIRGVGNCEIKSFCLEELTRFFV